MPASPGGSDGQIAQVFGGQRRDQDDDGPLFIGFPFANGEAFHLADVCVRRFFHPANVSACFLGIVNPGRDGLGR